DVRARDSSTSDTIEIYWNGEQVGIVDPGSTDWETVSFDVIGTGADDVLEFREAAGESDSLGAHMDNITLIEVPMTLAENATGSVVGTVSSFDPDDGDSVSFAVSDDRFEVVDGTVKLKDDESLDFEAEQSVDLTITATDSDGLEASEDITIDVQDVADTTTVTGTDFDDTLTSSDGDDILIGGDGDDLFIFDAEIGNDSVNGGEGWTDTLDLSAATDNGAVYGDDWTVTLSEGDILSETADSITLSDDAAGLIEFENGDTIDFSNIEQIGF
ncbi:MAG: cadherin repeat domain-containing protein, partial [Pseudomonadota bacterium]